MTVRYIYCIDNGRGRTRAFSLTEVLMALLLVACAIIPIFMMFSRGNEGVVRTRDEILAHTYATELLDYAQTLGYDRINSLPGFKFTDRFRLDELPIGGGALSKVEPNFARYLTVTHWEPQGSLRNWPMSYRFLTATVEWNSMGVQRFYKMTSLLYRGSLSPGGAPTP